MDVDVVEGGERLSREAGVPRQAGEVLLLTGLGRVVRGLVLPVATDYNATSHWKVRSTVTLGPPNWTKSRTFVLRFALEV